MKKNELKEFRMYTGRGAEADTVIALAAADKGVSAYLKRLVMTDAERRGVEWPGETVGRGGGGGKAKIVALWVYDGNSPNGHDCPRHGDFELAQAASNYHAAYGDTPECQRIAPSQARCKAERSDFGHVEAFRVVDAEKVLKFARVNF